MTLTFGVNPYDLCPETRERYHVVDDRGYIVAKYKYGHTGESDAFNRSDREPERTFKVIDTQDGGVYVCIKAGEEQSVSDAQEA